MMDQEDANEAAPEEAGPDARPRACHDTTNCRRREQTDDSPGGKERARHAESCAIAQVGDIAGKIRWIGLKEPADVRVPHATNAPPQAVGVLVGRMRIVRRVAVLVMPAMNGHPLQQGPLNRHRTESREHEFDDDVRFEGMVGK